MRVRGKFPRAGSAQFIGTGVVAAARKYKAEGYSSLPKLFSVNVARFGDDQTVIGTRQGRRAIILAKYRGLDTVQVAERMRINKEGLAITIFRGGKEFGVDIDPKFEKDLREMPFSFFCEVYLKPAFNQLQKMMEEVANASIPGSQAQETVRREQ